ncbi:MAG: 2-phosphosulfolactate phosphatase [Fretibacterium sp.]|nr:2-phosphosulfolactate phosphatase [Fretibacterium sp.]
MPRPVEADVVLACGEHLPAVDVWIVIDVLRATTVITRWFELGGGDLYPVASTSAARELARSLSSAGGAAPLLMGEENAIPPEGFDLGNSPLDLSHELVRSHPCAVMSTSNGTVSLLAAAATGTPVIAACVRNASAALEHALSIGPRLGILCAGRRRRPGWDDTLCAGLILNELKARHPEVLLADSARLALLAWRSSSGGLLESMRTADHAIFLDRIGYGADIDFACEQDAAFVVPMLHEEPEGDGMRAVLRAVVNTARPRPSPSAPEPESGINPDPFAPLLQYAQDKDEKQYFFLGGEARKRAEKKLDWRN